MWCSNIVGDRGYFFISEIMNGFQSTLNRFKQNIFLSINFMLLQNSVKKCAFCPKQIIRLVILLYPSYWETFYWHIFYFLIVFPLDLFLEGFARIFLPSSVTARRCISNRWLDFWNNTIWHPTASHDRTQNWLVFVLIIPSIRTGKEGWHEVVTLSLKARFSKRVERSW